MKVKFMVTYGISMSNVRQAGIEYPMLTIIMSYRSISSSSYHFPVGSYIFPNAVITLPSNPHHCYIMLKNFCQTFNAKFNGSVERYMMHCVNKLAPNFIREVNKIYKNKEMKKTDQEKINDLVTSSNLLTNGHHTIEVEIDI